MRIPRLSICLLILVSLTSGCSQTGWLRPGTTTIRRRTCGRSRRWATSLLPIVSGEPGSSLRASTDDPDSPPSTAIRISGRVYDDNGQPVPKAKVRLAVGSSPGGKINFATTDPSGAFTLRGLRANTAYTVIAEYQGEDGLMSGRAEVEGAEYQCEHRSAAARFEFRSESGGDSPGPTQGRPRLPPAAE